MKIKILHLFLLSIASGGWAQPKYKATIPVVSADSFYAIDLPHQVLGAALADCADLRIKDRNGREVAWLLKEDVQSKHDVGFIAYPSAVTSLARRTEVVVTVEKDTVSSFLVKIKNADVNKEAILLGTNDTSKWYVVKERFSLNNTSRRGETEALLDISFPLSDYTYYKLEISDSLSAPLNIIGVGRMKDEWEQQRNLLEVPLAKQTIALKEKTTEIELIYPFRYPINHLLVYVSSPSYYNRRLNIEYPYRVSGKSTLAHDLGSPHHLALDLTADTLRLSIDNGDDQPLQIDSIKSFIRKFFVVAALKEGMNYTLTFGDKEARYPEYDLSFGEQLPAQIEHLTVSNIEQMPILPVEQPQAPSAWILFIKTYGIWIIIAAVILQILFIVKKLINKTSENAPS